MSVPIDSPLRKKLPAGLRIFYDACGPESGKGETHGEAGGKVRSLDREANGIIKTGRKLILEKENPWGRRGHCTGA